MGTRVALFLAAFLILCGATVLFPAIDLAASAQFHVPGDGFPLGGAPLFRAIHASMPWLAAAIAAGGVALILARRWRAGIFVLLALAVGPGLIVNLVFKDHWGRARPAEIAAFGGGERFTPAFVPSDQCGRNCSFPAGDPANGFVLAAFGLIAPTPRRRRAVIAGSVGVGLFLGFVRMAQGGHFLSDVLASGFLVFASTWVLHRWIVADDGLRRLAALLRERPPSFRRFAWLLAACTAAAALSLAAIDRPLARLCAGSGEAARAVFAFITGFGIATPYLVIAALLALALAIAASGARRRQAALARAAWQAAFVFAAVAGPGLVGDILKPVFGRARPRLYLSDGIFGFTWHGARAAYWSFPSGHSITIVALAAALAAIDRRWLWPCIAAALLVMVSRIVLDEHYLSDVIAGAFLGLAGCWAVAALFRRAGIELGLNSP